MRRLARDVFWRLIHSPSDRCSLCRMRPGRKKAAVRLRARRRTLSLGGSTPVSHLQTRAPRDDPRAVDAGVATDRPHSRATPPRRDEAPRGSASRPRRESRADSRLHRIVPAESAIVTHAAMGGSRVRMVGARMARMITHGTRSRHCHCRSPAGIPAGEGARSRARKPAMAAGTPSGKSKNLACAYANRILDWEPRFLGLDKGPGGCIMMPSTLYGKVHCSTNIRKGKVGLCSSQPVYAMCRSAPCGF